ncbi:MAG TPA: SLC13 family permease [Anaerolineales bacterium]
MFIAAAVILAPLLMVAAGRWRVDLAALFMIVCLGAAQFMGLGILGKTGVPADALRAISGFSQPVVVTLIGLFILTQALTSNGIMDWLGQRLGRMAADSQGRLIALFSGASALLSLLMNNVAVGALLLPSAIQAARKSHIRPSKLLIPIAFGTALGGMTTYFTTANIVISNLLSVADPPQPPLGVLSFVPAGGLALLGGMAYLSLAGPRLLPNRAPAPEQALARRGSDELEGLYALGDRLWEARVLANSPYNGRTLKQARIGERFGLAVVAIWHGRHAILTPDAAETLRAGDMLLLVGREERIKQLSRLGLQIGREDQAISSLGVTLVELILAPHSAYVGKSVKELNFRRKYAFTVIALMRRDRSYRTDVGDISLEAGDSLLMIGPPERVRDLRIDPDVIILEPVAIVRAIPKKRALASVLIFLVSIGLSILGAPVYLAVLAAAVVAILAGLIQIQEAYRSIEWQVIFFIAGMYAASLAMVNTGLAGLIGRLLLSALSGTGALGLAAVSFLLAAALAQLMGSQATAFVIGPIVISAALHLGANAQAVAVAAAMGCSASFLTPLAHPVNVLMMGPGNYRFGDFAPVGVGLLAVVFAAMLAGMILFWKL